MSLPVDLAAAEAQLLSALESALTENAKGRWTTEMRFEGLRFTPVALRLQRQLDRPGRRCQLLFSDAGAAALAKRDAPDQSVSIDSLADWLARNIDPERLLLAVTPVPPDYEDVEAVCSGHQGAVVLLNGRLEDAAVGIGSVARERRRGFMAAWRSAYTLQPLANAALLHTHPNDWELYRLDPDGYRLAARFEKRPAPEELDEALVSGSQAGLRAVDRFVRELNG